MIVSNFVLIKDLTWFGKSVVQLSRTTTNWSFNKARSNTITCALSECYSKLRALIQSIIYSIDLLKLLDFIDFSQDYSQDL